MAKSKQRLLARELRKNGLGIKTIARKLQVSSSSVSIWCRDIRLTAGQVIELARRSRDPYYGKRYEYIEKIKRAKDESIRLLLEEGKRDIGSLSIRDMFIGGVCLYWAEGFKKDSLVGFANADPRMIDFFIRWLHDCCGIDRSRLRFRLTVNEGYRSTYHEIERFWSERLGINPLQFQKPYFQKVAWRKTYENPDEYHGVLRVRVSKSIALLRKIFGWIEGVQNAG
jgi:hypothetical protein